MPPFPTLSNNIHPTRYVNDLCTDTKAWFSDTRWHWRVVIECGTYVKRKTSFPNPTPILPQCNLPTKPIMINTLNVCNEVPGHLDHSRESTRRYYVTCRCAIVRLVRINIYPALLYRQSLFRLPYVWILYLLEGYPPWRCNTFPS